MTEKHQKSKNYDREERDRRSLDIERDSTSPYSRNSRRRAQDGDDSSDSKKNNYHNNSPARGDRGRNRNRSRDRDRSRDRGRNRSRDRSRSRSKEQKKKINVSQEKSAAKTEKTRIVWGNVGLEEEYEHQKKVESGENIPEEQKEKANFGLTGALAKDEVTGNIYNGVLLKWSEPLDAAPPPRGWRIYIFKNDEIVETLYLHRQSAYLFGREARVADHILQHPSCSSQHAVIQFRAITVDPNDMLLSPRRVVKPYIMDLASTNKTYLNSTTLEDSRYYELKPKDILKFGNSSREYVVIYDPEEAGGGGGGGGGARKSK